MLTLVGFKPCCNGFSSEASQGKSDFDGYLRCFKPCCNGFSSEAFGVSEANASKEGFKPCCNGFSSEAIARHYGLDFFFSFKPCCNGFSSEAGLGTSKVVHLDSFQTLL